VSPDEVICQTQADHLSGCPSLFVKNRLF